MLKISLYTLYHILCQVYIGFKKIIVNHKNNLTEKRRMDMAKALSYKKSTTVTVKAAGYVDIEKGVIETEEGNVSFKDLLKDFDGKYGEFQMKEKTDEDLELNEPSDEE